MYSTLSRMLDITEEDCSDIMRQAGYANEMAFQTWLIMQRITLEEFVENVNEEHKKMKEKLIHTIKNTSKKVKSMVEKNSVPKKQKSRNSSTKEAKNT